VWSTPGLPATTTPNVRILRRQTTLFDNHRQPATSNQQPATSNQQHDNFPIIHPQRFRFDSGRVHSSFCSFLFVTCGSLFAHHGGVTVQSSFNNQHPLDRPKHRKLGTRQMTRKRTSSSASLCRADDEGRDDERQARKLESKVGEPEVDASGIDDMKICCNLGKTSSSFSNGKRSVIRYCHRSILLFVAA